MKVKYVLYQKIPKNVFARSEKNSEKNAFKDVGLSIQSITEKLMSCIADMFLPITDAL